MSTLRKLAEGKPCMIRLPGCTGGGEDTVLAHYRMLPYSGVSIKPPDTMGAWACNVCHDKVDRRHHTTSQRDLIRFSHAEGVLRTLGELDRLGYKMVKE